MKRALFGMLVAVLVGFFALGVTIETADPGQGWDPKGAPTTQG